MLTKPPIFAITSILLLIALYIPFQNSQQLQAQSLVFIDNADRAEGTIIDGENVRKLLGNVVLRTEDMRMQADSAYQYLNRNLITAFNIQIESEEDVIWADTLYHDTFADISEFRGRVIIESPTNTVFSQTIDLISPLDIAVFRTPVRFEDESGTLLAQSGHYFQEADSAVFRGDVQLSDTTQYLEADSLFMNRTKELYELHGRVFADDFEDKVTFEGNYLLADSSGYRLLTGNDAWLMEVSESETDTTHLIAKTIELQETDTTSTMDAYQQVRIWSTKFSAIADTANYRDEEENFILRGNPVVWQKNIQLTGPYIEATLNNDEIDFLISYPRPIAVQEDSVTGRLNQMTGDTLHAYFDSGDLEKLVVFENSEIIFHLKDEEDQPDGLIEMVAAGASTMLFENGEFDDFKAVSNPDGSYLPEDPQIEERQLSNFQWDPNRKPQRPEIRLPRLDPIPPEYPFEFPPRYVKYLEERLISVQE